MKLAAHPLWLAGFRPFFALACLAGLSLPLAWALIYSGAVSPAPTFSVSALHWHAHEMFFGFGLAMLGGFLLTASKNWVAIRGCQGLPLLLLALAWLLDRVVMLFGAGLPMPLFLIAGSLFPAALVAMLLATLIRHRKNDSYPDNLYFIIALPLLLPAKWLLLSDTHFAPGTAMSIALFRLSFLIMLERTLTQFLRGALQLTVPRYAALDHSIKSLALVMVAAPFMPAPVPAVLSVALAILLAARWLSWHPWPALRRIDLGIMVLGHLAIILQLAFEALAVWYPVAWVGTVSVHLFTLGAMGLIIPAMVIRIARGHTGRKVVFESADKWVLWLMLGGLLLRIGLPQLFPAAYLTWILATAVVWLAAFGLLAWRYIPWLLQPRADGREH